jgi:hypothetical protein
MHGHQDRLSIVGDLGVSRTRLQPLRCGVHFGDQIVDASGIARRLDSGLIRVLCSDFSQFRLVRGLLAKRFHIAIGLQHSDLLHVQSRVITLGGSENGGSVTLAAEI